MNVFEDLIDELKEENLLETTVIESQQTEHDEYSGALKIDAPAEKPKEQTIGETETAADEQRCAEQEEALLIGREDVLEEAAEDTSAKAESVAQRDAVEELLIVGNDEIVSEMASPIFPAVENASKMGDAGEKEFYRKRAVEEVSGLQMVEHILSGIEREQMKTAPKNYNDIAAKKALHDFLQIAAEVKSPEHAQAEFQLLQETETWCSALSHRDKRISVAHLRRYCETTKPALSSQALISLARFYRNLPFSEQIRGKFDFVVTKLFSKDDGSEKRVLVFSREELINHLKELYAEWSSISLYAADDDDSTIVLAALKFEDFMNECEAAADFDELIKTDFFNRLRLFKESTDEVFFAPLVTASAIECNVRIGNRYVDLIRAERAKKPNEDLQDKYGFMHDQAISDATSKTLQLVELLKTKASAPAQTEAAPAKKKAVKIDVKKEAAREPFKETAERKTAPAAAATATQSQKTNRERPDFSKQSAQTGFLAGNKWLTAVLGLIIVFGGLYLLISYKNSASNSTNSKKVNLENSSLKQFLQSAQISNGTFFGITQPEWDSLPNQKKEELLKKIFAIGGDKGFAKVSLLNQEGKTVGSATAEEVEVITP